MPTSPERVADRVYRLDHLHSGEVPHTSRVRYSLNPGCLAGRDTFAAEVSTAVARLGCPASIQVKMIIKMCNFMIWQLTGENGSGLVGKLKQV